MPQNNLIKAPFIHSWKTSAKVTWICFFSLLPVVAWSIFLYEEKALYVWLVSIGSAIISELFVSVLTKKITISDGSAMVTGLLVACAMPAGVPLYIPACASVFAILIVKATFGGYGSNWMNPALAGVAFAHLNWPQATHTYLLPKIVAGVDGMTSATPLTFAHDLTETASGKVMEVIQNAGYPVSAIDSDITNFLNNFLFSKLGVRLPEGYIDLGIGFKPGALGESALILVLIGSIIIITHGMVKLSIPVSMIVTFSILAKLFGTGLPGEDFFKGDILYAISNGGLLLSAFYMATEPVSSPTGFKASIFYGMGIGFLCFLFRRWGVYSEGVAYAILIMNVAVPYIEKINPFMFTKKDKAI